MSPTTISDRASVEEAISDRASVKETKEEETCDLDALVDELDDEKEPENETTDEADEGPSNFKAVPEDKLQTDQHQGLTDAEVRERKKQYGLNEMSEERENHLKKFLLFFVGPIQFVMEAAAILAAGLRDWVDCGVIGALLLLNALIGFFQEKSAGDTVAQLKKTLALKATVMRNGHLVEIEAKTLVPGDIVQLEEGVVAPADGRVITEGAFFQVDQSALTGESLPVVKHYWDPVSSSSTVKHGKGFMVVTAIGDSTYVGRTAGLVGSTRTAGHFTKILQGMGVILLTLVVFTLALVWISSFFRSKGIVQILEYTLAITIVGVPVGLPAVVTTTMAVGAMYVAKRGAIVQKLSAIESLAGVEILCSDKTGTLTKNKLTCQEPFCVSATDPMDIVLTAALATTRTKRADPIDIAVLKSLKKWPTARALVQKYKTIDFTPFDHARKRVQAVVESPEGERYTVIKGAAVAVLKVIEEDHPVPDDMEGAFNAQIKDYVSRNLKSVGVARKREGCDWELLGLLCLSDPPRHDTAQTIREAMNLGLNVKMLTGDSVGIAKEVCRQLGLGCNIFDAELLGLGTGAGPMTGHELCDFVEAANGFGDVLPEHKFRVIEILQDRGYLVAMTGDGVNDAPSLKKADTGIAVEGATEAARSAADIVFTAPGLSSIIDSIKTSRQIFHRMYSYVIYRIALSLHLEIFLGLWVAIRGDSLNLNLLVFIAIFADIATLAIAYDNAPFSPKPVSWNVRKIWGLSVVLGIILAIGTWIALSMMIKWGSGAANHGGIVAKTGVRDPILFLEIVLTQNWLIFITRAAGPFWSSLPSWQLTGAIFLVDVVATLFTIFGWFVGGKRTDILTVVRVWIFSFAIFCFLAVIFYLLNGSAGFDNIVNGKPLKGKKERKDLEDFVVSLQRISTVHETNRTLR
ncbi:MAG: plasma membrane H+-ATPase [Bathelium mastoideum]|nr:MAG: plasma membrane H+-ATPase [Bathelium mastoideum]